MYAYVMTKPGVISREIVADPIAGPDDVVLQTEVSTLCKTDIEYFLGHLTPDAWPIVPGHEYVGRVVEVGKNLKGIVDIDRRMTYWGQTDFGGQAEYRCIRPIFPFHQPPPDSWYTERGFVDDIGAAACFLPETVQSAHGCIAEPLTSVMRSTLNTPPRPGSTVVILGSGPSGMLALQMFRNYFAVGRIVVLDRDRDRLSVAGSLGADIAANSDDQLGEIEDLIRDSQGAFADYVFDALPHVDPAGTGHPIRAIGTRLLRPGGTYNVYGATGIPQAVDWWQVLAKGLQIRAAAFDVRVFPMLQSSFILQQAVRLIAHGIIRAEPLISSEVTWNDGAGVHRAFTEYARSGAMKSSIVWNTATAASGIPDERVTAA